MLGLQTCTTTPGLPLCIFKKYFCSIFLENFNVKLIIWFAFWIAAYYWKGRKNGSRGGKPVLCEPQWTVCVTESSKRVAITGVDHMTLSSTPAQQLRETSLIRLSSNRAHNSNLVTLGGAWDLTFLISFRGANAFDFVVKKKTVNRIREISHWFQL